MKNPKLIVKPFAKNGQKNVIPENYETSMESNQATWDQGFGQITMLPVAAGGLPPKGQDFNGIFNQISENIVYLSQGGRFKFSAEYAEAIGGYPKGAVLQSDDEKKEYLSLIDNNKVDFNTATDISASWKLVNTDDLLAQIASKQPKGDYATKTELNSGLAGKQPVGDYATKTEVNSKLAKDQNGADIPNKDTFIKNLGLPEKYQPKGKYADGSRFQVGSNNASMSPPGGTYSFVINDSGGIFIWDGSKSVFSVSVSGEIMLGSMDYSRLKNVPLVQTTGNSTTSFMSQKATSDLLIATGELRDVIGQRTVNNTYINSSSRPRFVTITGDSKETGSVSVVVNGITIQGLSTGGASVLPFYCSFFVPIGGSYRLNSTGAFNLGRWTELS